MESSANHLAAERLEQACETCLPPGKRFPPPVVPLTGLPQGLVRYQQACDELAERFGASTSIRPWLDQEFARSDAGVLSAIDGLDPMERQALMTVLCTLAHTYGLGTTPPEPAAFALTHLMLPPGIGEPWTHLAALPGQPRVGSLWSVALCNRSLVSQSGGSPFAVDELTSDSQRLSHGWLRAPLGGALVIFILTLVETEARGSGRVTGGGARAVRRRQ